jgi:hypothetical protein
VFDLDRPLEVAAQILDVGDGSIMVPVPGCYRAEICGGLLG